MSSLLEPVAALLNRGIEASASARGLCAELENRRLALVLEPAGTRVCLAARDGQLATELDDAGDCDAELKGTALGFGRLLLGDAQAVLREGTVRISGDTEIAEKFQALLEMARPEPEAELAKLVGDVAAHQLGNTARGLSAWSKQAGNSLGRSLSEYLREERHDLPTRTEMREHLDAVDDFAAGVDRAAARLASVRARQQH